MSLSMIALLVFMYCVFIMPFTKSAQKRADEEGNFTNMYWYIGSMLLTLLFFALGL